MHTTARCAVHLESVACTTDTLHERLSSTGAECVVGGSESGSSHCGCGRVGSGGVAIRPRGRVRFGVRSVEGGAEARGSG